MDYACNCRDCETKRKNQQKHLEWPFYKKVDKVTKEIATEQILKGSEKYPNPFSPDDWTNLELVRHQLQELRDAQVYSVGLLDRLEKQEERLKFLEDANARLHNELSVRHTELELLKNDVQYWRAVANGS